MRSEESVPIKLAGGLTARARDVGNVTILEFEGEICRKKAGGSSLFEHINDELTRGKKKFVFSFRNLGFVDSYGIGEIMASYTSIKNAGGMLKFACLPKKILLVMNVTLLTPPWRMRPQEDGLHGTVEEALASYGLENSVRR